MKVTVLGIRGIPNVQGGVETHAEQLYKRISALGCEVEALVRTPFVPATEKMFGQVRIRRIWSPTRAGAEALIHSLLGVLYAAVTRPDILHIHAIGPAIVTPLARLFGLKVVVTHHGPDYDRDKWGRFAKWVLKTGEKLGMRYANQRIVISKVIADSVYSKFNCYAELIPNGVVSPALQTGISHIERFGLEPGRYFLQVSRLVPEKRQLDLIRAFQALGPTDWKLALVGGIDTTPYSQAAVRLAESVPGVVLTNYLKGAALGEIYTHAGAFVLPSSHEGLPIAMLEALSYGLPVLASDIPANLELGLEDGSYFKMGDIAALTTALKSALRVPATNEIRTQRMAWVAHRYDWEAIAERTVEIYKAALAKVR